MVGSSPPRTPVKMRPSATVPKYRRGARRILVSGGGIAASAVAGRSVPLAAAPGRLHSRRSSVASCITRPVTPLASNFPNPWRRRGASTTGVCSPA